MDKVKNNEERANFLVIQHPEIFNFIKDMCDYRVQTEKRPTNEFEASKAFFRRQALEDFIGCILTLNQSHMKKLNKPDNSRPKIEAR